jgi:hypothetical protein
MSRIAPFRTISFAIATQERHTCISGWLARALELWRRWRKEAPEATIPEEAMAERLVQAEGRMEIGDGQAGSSDQELQGAAEAVGSGADVQMVEPQPPSRQGLRAEGADQRDPHRDIHNSPATKTTREGSMNPSITCTKGTITEIERRSCIL